MNVLNRVSIPVRELAMCKIRNVSTRAIKKPEDGGNGTIYVA
jgi:hypothetical protein